ncbi:MAG: hypothetical protein ACYSWU_15915, partial [Planctomycetota bacterium]
FGPRYSPWTSDEDLKSRGGVILWDCRRRGDQLPVELRERFGTAEVLDPLTISCQTGARTPPVRVGAAIVPPGSDRRHRTARKSQPPSSPLRR